MRSRLLVIASIFFFLGCDTSSSVDPVFKDYFIKYYGSDGDTEGIDMIVNADNTVTLLGNSISPSGSRLVYLAKVDSEGNILWHQEFGNGFEYAQDIEALPAGGFIILSNVWVGEESGKNLYNFKLIRVDDSGNKIDSLVYDVLRDQFGRSVTPLSNGGYFVAGKTIDIDTLNTNDNSLPGGDFEDLLVVQFDNTFTVANANEDRISESTFGAIDKIFETSPGNYTYAAFSNELKNQDNVNDLNFTFRSFTFDPGSVPSTYIGDDVKDEVMNKSFRSIDGSIYGIGMATSSTSTNSSVFLCKVRNSQNSPSKIFENSFGIGRLEGVSVYANATSCFVLANRYDEADGTRDIWFTKVNAITGDQEPLWADGLTFGTTTNDDTGSSVAELANGDILMLATFNITNQRKMAIVKVDAKGSFE